MIARVDTPLRTEFDRHHRVRKMRLILPEIKTIIRSVIQVFGIYFGLNNPPIVYGYLSK